MFGNFPIAKPKPKATKPVDKIPVLRFFNTEAISTDTQYTFSHLADLLQSIQKDCNDFIGDEPTIEITKENNCSCYYEDKCSTSCFEVKFRVRYSRLETDEELEFRQREFDKALDKIEKRKIREKERAIKKQQEELAEYERLKKKFEKNSK